MKRLIHFLCTVRDRGLDILLVLWYGLDELMFGDTLADSLCEGEKMTEILFRDGCYEVHKEVDKMMCGHPRSCIVQADGGTAICAWCEEVAQLRRELEQVITYKVALDTVPVMIHGTPCDTCGGTDWQCAECLESIADYDSVRMAILTAQAQAEKIHNDTR